MSRVKKRNKPIFTPSRIVFGVALLVAVLIFYPMIANSRVDKNKLYKKAGREMAIQDYEGATKSLRAIVDLDPNYKDAGKKLDEAKKLLYKQATNSIAAGDLEQAEARLVTLSDTDPDYKDVPDLIDDVEEKQADEQSNDSDGGDTGGDQSSDPGGSNPDDSTDGGDTGDGDSDPGDNGSSSLKEIGANDLPIDLLPKSTEGYKIIQNGWLAEPVQAGSVFIPRDAAVRKEIDRGILTVAKHEDEKTATDRFEEHKDAFPTETEEIEINGHSAYFGLYAESKPKVFPPMARIMWTRGEWFFYMDVLPSNAPSTSFKKQIVFDLVEKFGY